MAIFGSIPETKTKEEAQKLGFSSFAFETLLLMKGVIA